LLLEVDPPLPLLEVMPSIMELILEDMVHSDGTQIIPTTKESDIVVKLLPSRRSFFTI